MSRVLIRAGKVADAISLAPRLREEDRVEIELSSGKDALTVLLESVAESHECFVGSLGGTVIAIGGVVINNGVGVPWLVCSDEAVRFPIQLVAAGKEAVSRWESMCHFMCNASHPENTTHHRWLERIGFTFHPELVPVGPNAVPYRYFYRYSTQCVNQQQSYT